MTNTTLIPLSKSWSGAPLPTPCQIFSGKRDGFFYFGAVLKRKPVNLPKVRRGTFVEGLWEFDCIELFLAQKKSGEYLELNLGFQGAYWIQHFTAPRKRGYSLSDISVETQTFTSNGWYGVTLIGPEALVSMASHANMTIVQSTPHGPVYSSSTKLPGITADFHQPKHFASVSRFF